MLVLLFRGSFKNISLMARLCSLDNFHSNENIGNISMSDSGNRDGATISKVGGLNSRKIPAFMLLSQPKQWPRYQS